MKLAGWLAAEMRRINEAAAEEEREAAEEAARANEEKLQEQAEAMRSVATRMESTFGSVFFDAMTGRFEDLGDAAEAFYTQLLRMATDYAAKMAVQELFGGDFMAGDSNTMGGLLGGVLGGLFASAQGNVFHNTRPVPFAAGGVLTKPTFFPMANGGVGLAGEAGWEGIFPLTRLPDGDLGVKAERGSDGGGYNIFLTVLAVDPKSFGELVERNPQAIGVTVTKLLRNNTEIRRAIKEVL